MGLVYRLLIKVKPGVANVFPKESVLPYKISISMLATYSQISKTTHETNKQKIYFLKGLLCLTSSR